MSDDYPKYQFVQEVFNFGRCTRKYTKKYKDAKDAYGTIDGEFVECNDQGQVLHKAMFVEGKVHGEYQGWYPNGQLWYQAHYVDGQRQGLFKHWNPDGTLKYQCTYLDNQVIPEVAVQPPATTKLSWADIVKKSSQ